MRFFLVLLFFFSLSPSFSKPQQQLGAFKDRLVAVVEKNAITEKDLVTRFELYQQIYPTYQGKSYSQMRENLLEEICVDQIHDLLWAALTHNRILEIAPEQLEAFRAHYPNLTCDDDLLKTVYAAWLKRDQLARHMVHSKINISQQDLAAATRQPMVWQALEAQWSFDLAYSETPFSEAKAQSAAQHFVHYPVMRVAPNLLQSIHWSQLHTWQFFEDEGEYVAFRLNGIQISNLLPYIYEIQLIPTNEHAKEAPLALKLTTPNEASPEMWALIHSLSAGQTSDQSIALNGKQYFVQLINDREPTSLALIENRLTEVLVNHRAQERIPGWYAELKNDYFIKVFHP